MLSGFILPPHPFHDVFQFPSVRGDQVFLQGACLEFHHDVIVVGADQAVAPFKVGDLHDLRIGKVEGALHAHGLVILQVQDDLGLGVVDDAFPKPSFIQVKEVIQVLAGTDGGTSVPADGLEDGIGLPKAEKPQQKSGFRTRNIDTQKTLTMEQIQVLLEKSKDTPIHMQVLFNVLMGLRRSEINGVKYSDVDYINRTLKVERQLGRVHNTAKEDFAPKTFTKQEVGLKTKSSYREIPIPDYVFEAILKERQVYEKNRNRRKKEFQDLDYICCYTFGRARSKGFHCRYYKQLLAESGLPNIRWHDLRSTYCTLLLKEAFNPKAVSKLMGHAKELITIDVYGDNKGIIADGVPEIETYMKEVLPNMEEMESFKKELLEIVMDVTEFLPEAG